VRLIATDINNGVAHVFDLQLCTTIFLTREIASCRTSSGTDFCAANSCAASYAPGTLSAWSSRASAALIWAGCERSASATAESAGYRSVSVAMGVMACFRFVTGVVAVEK
jgi:hypothetical protein